MKPGILGIDLCRKIRSLDLDWYPYILLLTAKGDKNELVAGLDAGADDYLTKPFDFSELLARIRVGRRVLDLHDKLFAAQESLKFQATHDALTRVWNRGAVFGLMEAELDRARRNGHLLAVLMVDLDHFKKINDDHGHLTGDEVLRQVAASLIGAVRSYDIVGRYGGEEFLIAGSHNCVEDAVHLAERLRQRIAAVQIPQLAFPVTASIGIAVLRPDINTTIASLIQMADIALYDAKHNGRNRNELAPATCLPSL
jgi:diguanylate cyclase (GGDEF)-like protein